MTFSSNIPSQPQPALNNDRGWRLSSDTVLRWQGLNWQEGAWLQIPILHRGPTISQVLIELWVAGEEEPRFSVIMGTMPEVFCRLGISSAWLDAQQVFFPRTPGRLKATSFGRRLQPAEVSAITLRCMANDWQQETVVGEPILTYQPTWPVRAPLLSDELGQRADIDWPGKIRDLEEIRQLRDQPLPAAMQGRGRWGGDGCPVAATGFFRTWRDASGRWWLIDPDGERFFSTGLDCVSPAIQATVVQGTEALYAWLPENAPCQQASPWAQRSGQATHYDMGSALLERAWGPEWYQHWSTRTTALLRHWGFNTVANWSDKSYALASGLPYVLPMPAYPRTEENLFRDLPDVYAPEFQVASEQWAQALAEHAGRPAFIGYFLNNEPAWAFGRYNLAAEMLESRPGSHSRRAFADFLRHRYQSDAALAQAWDGTVNGFQDVIAHTLHRMGERSTRAAADCWDFSRLLAERYVTIPAAAARAVAPQHLCLGIRWAWISSDLCYCGAQAADVFTINCYQFAIPEDSLSEIARHVDRPVMVGEFHFGTIARGLPATGLKAVADEAARGLAYRHFVEHAAAHPHVVGTHYFTLYDEHCLGRFDGENFQIGLLDITQQPYTRMLEQVIACHQELYAVASGQQPPTTQCPAETSRIAF